MQISTYNSVYTDYFESANTQAQMNEAVQYLLPRKRLFFIGNGGSNSICSHMMEDYAKIGGYQTFCFSDPALITCFANDYGYERAMEEWVKVYMEPADTLIAISSSGNSANIINAANYAKSIGAGLITLSGFDEDNKLKPLGDLNFHIPVRNYGVVECFHQIIVHAILDEIAIQKAS